MNTYLFWLRLLAWWSLSSLALAQTPTPAVKLDQPVAFCVAPLAECTPDKYQPVTSPLGYYNDHLEGGSHNPITLVYSLPPEFAQTKDLSLLVGSNFQNHCFLLQ